MSEQEKREPIISPLLNTGRMDEDGVLLSRLCDEDRQLLREVKDLLHRLAKPMYVTHSMPVKQEDVERYFRGMNSSQPNLVPHRPEMHFVMDEPEGMQLATWEEMAKLKPDKTIFAPTSSRSALGIACDRLTTDPDMAGLPPLSAGMGTNPSWGDVRPEEPCPHIEFCYRDEGKRGQWLVLNTKQGERLVQHQWFGDDSCNWRRIKSGWQKAYAALYGCQVEDIKLVEVNKETKHRYPTAEDAAKGFVPEPCGVTTGFILDDDGHLLQVIHRQGQDQNLSKPPHASVVYDDALPQPDHITGETQ